MFDIDALVNACRPLSLRTPPDEAARKAAGILGEIARLLDQ
jgi:hypothetical protein